MTLDEAKKKERLSDELRAIQLTSVAIRDDETYEQNLDRRAKLKMREGEILRELYDY